MLRQLGVRSFGRKRRFFFRSSCSLNRVGVYWACQRAGAAAAESRHMAGVGSMAIGLIFEGPGVTQAQYEQARNEVAPDNKRPPGMLYHVAGPTESGGWRVIEVWESQEAVDRFFKEKLGQALQHANISIQPQTFQVHNIMQ